MIQSGGRGRVSASMTAVSPRQRPIVAPSPQVMLAGDMPGTITGFQRLGYIVLVLYLFLIYSRVFDVKFSKLHIPGISYRLILVLLLLSRAFVPALKHPIGKSFALLTLWFMAAIPTSLWRGGSFNVLTVAMLPAVVIYLATAGLIVSFDQCQRAAHVVGWALFVLTLIAVVWGSTEETGRLFLPQGKFSNPNEMGQALLLAMPLWWMILLDSPSVPKKAFAAGVMLLVLVVVSKTGSRGALIGFAVLVFAIFLRAPIMGKMKLIVGGGVLLAVIVVTMPGRLLRRYTTISEEQESPLLSSEADYSAAMEHSAISSARSRKYLLQESIRLTIRHPLFGVGPGMFAVADDLDAKARGATRGAWQGTHNSYTQVSSETGIPGALAYVGIIFFSLRRTSKLYARTRGDPRLKNIASCALCLNYCLIVYAVTVFFDYIAFTSMLSVFAGLAAALDINAPKEIERLTATPLEERIPFEQFRPNWRTPAGVAPQV